MSYEGARDLNDYTGRFRNYGFGDIDVTTYNTSEGDKLAMEYGVATFLLIPTETNDTFAVS